MQVLSKHLKVNGDFGDQPTSIVVNPLSYDDAVEVDSLTKVFGMISCL